MIYTYIYVCIKKNITGSKTHSAPYFPDQTPYEFCIFPKIKKKTAAVGRFL